MLLEIASSTVQHSCTPSLQEMLDRNGLSRSVLRCLADQYSVFGQQLSIVESSAGWDRARKILCVRGQPDTSHLPQPACLAITTSFRLVGGGRTCLSEISVYSAVV